MDAPELQETTAVERMHKAARSEGTVDIYSRSIAKYFQYCYNTNRRILSAQFILLVATLLGDVPKIDKSFVEKHVLERPASSPWPLSDEWTVEGFEQWICSLRTKHGKQPVPSTLSSHRSALNFLFTSFKLQINVADKGSLTEFFKGAKRTAARTAKDNGEKVKEGKAAMPFAVYAFLAARLLALGTSDAIFAHLFMVLSWNLMCRAGNTETIHINHIEWINDALAIYFAHT
jgi:hypothetical protein